MDIETFVMDYLKGEVPFEEFVKHPDDLEEFLQPKYDYCLKNHLRSFHSYNHGLFLQEFSNIMARQDCFSKKSDLYSIIYSIIVKSGYRDLSYYFKYFDDSSFCTDYIPEYLNSAETSVLFEKYLFPFIPQNVTKKAMKEFVKAKCAEIFDLKDSKKPYWAQESEWPVRNGKACRFLSRYKDGDLVIFKFQDVTNDDIVLIEQFY